MLWKPTAKKDLMELSGPMKRITPKGLLLANPGKQMPTPDSSGIECGKCHMVIYKADNGFDAEAFEEAKRRHHSISPTCEKEK